MPGDIVPNFTFSTPSTTNQELVSNPVVEVGGANFAGTSGPSISFSPIILYGIIGLTVLLILKIFK